MGGLERGDLSGDFRDDFIDVGEPGKRPTGVEGGCCFSISDENSRRKNIRLNENMHQRARQRELYT
jgi:hypothetical protein